MSINGSTSKQSGRGHRPRATTVFAAAFIAGAAAAFGVNRALDVHIAQSKPRVESEPIFVALRSLPQGAAVTVWDVALRDWPKAMMPAAALRPQDSFEGAVLKHPIREGQPLLAFQLAKAPTESESQMAGSVPAALPAAKPVEAIPQPDLWAPGEQPVAPATAAAAPAIAPIEPAAETVTPPTTGEPTVAGAPPVEPVETAVEPEVVSVVQSAPTTDIEAPLAATPHAQPVAATPAVRYLVVPERIAMQADRSFVAPAPTRPTMPQPTQPVQQSQPTEQVKPQQVAKQPPPVREAPQSIQQRPRTARQPRSTATPQQPAPQRPATNSQRPAPAKPRSNSSTFQSMFPNLSAGMTAVEEQLQKIKRDREAASETPDEQPQPAQRSARSF